ncbi:MAG: hypothetical protein AAFV53_21705 [Myxococcota bacterium]
MASWICWLAWSGSSTLLAVALSPLVRLRRTFASDLSLRTAGSERGLVRAASKPLRDLPGGRSGQIALDASGDVITSVRSAAVVLRAERDGVRIVRAAGLETSPRTGRPWTAVPANDLIQPGARYRISGLFFLID